MSHVKPRRCNSPASPQTPERYRCDDRATVGAKPRDVGQHPLIRGFTHVRASVWGCPGLRTGVDLAIGLTARSGIPLAAAPLPPLHEIIFTGPCPGAGSLKIWFARAAGSLRTSRLTLLQQAQGIARPAAQMKPASSRATAVMATVLSLPLRISAR